MYILNADVKLECYPSLYEFSLTTDASSLIESVTYAHKAIDDVLIDSAILNSCDLRKECVTKTK